MFFTCYLPILSYKHIMHKRCFRGYNYLKNNRLGRIYIPINIYFHEDLQSAVQPDLTVILEHNRKFMQEDRFYGSPDIIVEVLSEDEEEGQSRDTGIKKDLYQRAGVPEYITVKPFKREVTAYFLKEGVYEQNYNEVGKFRSSILNLEFELERDSFIESLYKEK